MTSEVVICNQALSWLGASQIISLDDNTTNARLCKANYSQLRDATTQSAAWSFATQRFIWNPITTPPEYGYAQQFLIPNTVLRVLEVQEDAGIPNGTNDLDWRREGKYIVCDKSVIYAKCIIQVIDIQLTSFLYQQALAARLAAVLSPTITESNTKTKELWALYGNYMSDAVPIDASQGKSDRARGRSLNRRVR